MNRFSLARVMLMVFAVIGGVFTVRTRSSSRRARVWPISGDRRHDPEGELLCRSQAGARCVAAASDQPACLLARCLGR